MALDIEITWEDTPFQPARVIPAVPAKTITLPYPEGYVRAIAANPGSGLRKEFVKACQKWVEENPEKIDLDKLAPGSVFRRIEGVEGVKQGVGSVRILTTTGWQYADGVPANSFVPLYKGYYGHTLFEPVVLVS